MPLLDQTCHACGVIEASGAYCTSCGARTVDDWHPVKVSARLRDHLARHGFRGRPAHVNADPTPGSKEDDPECPTTA